MEFGFNEISFLLVVFSFSGINNYLLTFDTAGRLPASIGFNLFAKIGHIAIAVMSIWNLGWIWGIIFYLTYLLNLINGSFTWIITYSLSAKDIERGTNPTLNGSVYSFFSFLTLITVVLCIVSFFTGEFENFKAIIEYYDYTPAIIFGIAGVVGFGIRYLLLKKLCE